MTLWISGDVMRFYIPPHMARNYDDFLKTEVCQDIKYCTDFTEDKWFDARAEITRINYKSKQYGSDGSVQMRFSKSLDLQKGDMIIFNDVYYMVSWFVHDVIPDAKLSIIDYCNCVAMFKRKCSSTSSVDPETGNYIGNDGQFDDGYEPITGLIHGVYTVNGTYEKRHKNSQAGTFNDNRTSFSCQANKETKKIKRGDVFMWQGEIHQVDDIIYSELNTKGDGILVFHLGLALNSEIVEDGF